MSLADPHAQEFEAHRSLLMGAAYRMLGSVSDAEDMVQETWLRWRRTPEVASPKNWLLTVISRLCLDRLKSARVQREQYYGTWLPEPFAPSSPPSTEVDETVSLALMVVLEKLSPEERASFLLHEVFGYPFAEIAGILNKSEAACRKLVSRARNRVRTDKPRFPTTHAEHENLLSRFLAAARSGEMEPLMALFGESVSLYSDGGGRAPAIPQILTDHGVIARFFINIIRRLDVEKDRHSMRVAVFNGAPGLLIYTDGRLATAIAIDIRDGKIAAIFGHRNPDKLRFLE